MGYDRIYFLKKAYGIYPGVRRAVSADALADHYRRRRERRGPLRGTVDALVGLGFLGWIGWRAGQVQRKFGLSDAWRRDAIRIARARFADPNDIFLFRIRDASELETYIRRFEDAAINKILNPAGWTRDCALADKRLFYARCAAAGLPHPATIAETADGAIVVRADPDGVELVAKPADGEGGEGVRMLGSFADRADLAARLPAILASARGAIVVQPRIATHPALADLALNALPTVRIVTMLDETSEPEVVSATVRFASVPEARVDNMKAGGLLAAVDLDSGALGIACQGYGGGDHTVHPATGAVIAGRLLPGWDGAKALAVRAHRSAFSEYVVIGWDVALTPQGAILIEGNGKPGVLMPQRAARRGLAQGRYGALLSHNLAIKS